MLRRIKPLERAGWWIALASPAMFVREIRKEFPKVKEQLWGGEFWEDGYFARTVGDKVTAEVIKAYIRFHEQRAKRPEQLQLL